MSFDTNNKIYTESVKKKLKLYMYTMFIEWKD